MVKPSISFLPMEDIAADLIENKKLMTEDKVADVINDSTKSLAKCIDNERNTVENSKKLNGKDADEYMTAKDGIKISGVADNMSVLFSGEVRNLRDELYQLKSQLCKNGYIEEETPYEGFQDAFRKNKIKYETFVSKILESSISLTDTLHIEDKSKIKDFEIGKHFIIKKIDTHEQQLVTVIESDKNGRIKFYPSSSLLFDKETVELHKTYGNYIKDSFSFSEITSGIDIEGRERYHMQSDDSSTELKKITSSNCGYAASFKVPKSCTPKGKAAITGFSIITQAFGTPGNLLCHIIKEEAAFTNEKLSPKFTSIQDAKDKGFLIATSQPIKAENAMNQDTLTFDFFNKNTNAYPEITDIRYLFVIECTNADEDNFWKMMFSFYQGEANSIEDLEKYNTSLVYKKISDDSDLSNKSLNIIDGIDKYDLLFTLSTKDIIEQTEYGKPEGLYTTKIILPKPIDVSRARLTTRINREGCYYVESYDDTYTNFVLAKEDQYAYSAFDLRFDENDIIIIGNQIGRVKKSTSNKVQLQEPIYIDSRIEKLYTKNNTSTKIPVYRMNYNISIKPYLVDWNNFNTENKTFQSKDITDKVIDLNLVAVLPTGNNKIGSRISDRLLFECEFGIDNNNIAKLANEFELQIKWKSKFDFNEINKKENIQNDLNELIGRIHEMILTFDKNY